MRNFDVAAQPSGTAYRRDWERDAAGPKPQANRNSEVNKSVLRTLPDLAQGHSRPREPKLQAGALRQRRASRCWFVSTAGQGPPWRADLSTIPVWGSQLVEY